MPIVGQFGSLAGLGSLILPGGAMESIATVTVGSGGTSEIDFTSIPETYQHLQIRGVGRTDRSSAAADQLRLRVNGDSTSANYAIHFLTGTGSAAGAEGYTSQGLWNTYNTLTGPSATSSVFGAVVIDILDYASTSKNKVMRAFGGQDRNGSGELGITSGLWLSTSAITSIKLIKIGSNFVQHTTYALYGIKAP